MFFSALRCHLWLTCTGNIYKAVPRFGEFCSAVAYLFCLNLPAAFSRPRKSLLVKLCKYFADVVLISIAFDVILGGRRLVFPGGRLPSLRK